MMTAQRRQIERFIATGRLREAGRVLDGLLPASVPNWRDELVVWQAALTELETRERQSPSQSGRHAAARKRLAAQLLKLSNVCEEQAGPERREDRPVRPSVFLSYNHADGQVAAEVAQALTHEGIAIEVDAQTMVPGALIQQFISQAIRGTDATVCIVSANSLVSGWVGRETALTLAQQDLGGRRRFVACYLDAAFLDPGFRLQATQAIDQRLAQIEALVSEYDRQRLDSNDLNDEKSRLYELRHKLGTVLAHLRGSLCLDIRADARAASLKRLIASLRDGPGLDGSP